MSNANAIAAVTGKLRDMLAEKSGLGSQSIATEPLDQIAGLGAGKRLNLYLYQILPNAHWRNGNIPWRTRNGEAPPGPLALDLRLLLKATSRNHIEAQSCRGPGVRAGADHPAPPLDRRDGAVVDGSARPSVLVRRLRGVGRPYRECEADDVAAAGSLPRQERARLHRRAGWHPAAIPGDRADRGPLDRRERNNGIRRLAQIARACRPDRRPARRRGENLWPRAREGHGGPAHFLDERYDQADVDAQCSAAARSVFHCGGWRAYDRSCGAEDPHGRLSRGTMQDRGGTP